MTNNSQIAQRLQAKCNSRKKGTDGLHKEPRYGILNSTLAMLADCKTTEEDYLELERAFNSLTLGGIEFSTYCQKLLISKGVKLN